MADFNTAHKKVMGNEGGYANNPADAGGETYKGIARKFWPQWGGWKLVDGVKACVASQPGYGTAEYHGWAGRLNAQLASLNQLQQLVLDFYRANFWDKYWLSEVNDQDVADWIYDHAVNGGGRGVMWVQEAAGVAADGVIGPQTIRAINAADPQALLAKARDLAVAYRLEKVRECPEDKQFLHSWLARDGAPEDKINQIMAEV